MSGVNMAKNKKAAELLNDYLYATFVGVIAQTKALSSLEHKLTKGELREIFLKNLLSHFLPSYLSVGSGIIINNKGDQSKQTDIIIYDNRVLPPFLHSDNLNIYPIEAIISTVEAKSILNFGSVKSAEKKAAHLIDNVWNKNNWFNTSQRCRPICCVFGFDGNMIKTLSTNDNKWINKSFSNLTLICSVGKFSWVKMDKGKGSQWYFGEADKNYGEIRRFIGILIDNLRTVANENLNLEMSTGSHKDWLGQYIRYLGSPKD
jgi:hypothetical protein